MKARGTPPRFDTFHFGMNICAFCLRSVEVRITRRLVEPWVNPETGNVVIPAGLQSFHGSCLEAIADADVQPVFEQGAA